MKSHYLTSPLSPRGTFDSIGSLINNGPYVPLDSPASTNIGDTANIDTANIGSSSFDSNFFSPSSEPLTLSSSATLTHISPVTLSTEEVIARLTLSVPEGPEAPIGYQAEEESYIVITAFGGVVFFNVPEGIQGDCLGVIWRGKGSRKKSKDFGGIQSISNGNDTQGQNESRGLSLSPTSSSSVIEEVFHNRGGKSPILPAQNSAHNQKRVKKSPPSPSPFTSRYTETYEIHVHHSPPTPNILRNNVHPTHASVSTLTPYNLSVISTIMCQTVALDHYVGVVDGLLERFDRVNEAVSRENENWGERVGIGKEEVEAFGGMKDGGEGGQIGGKGGVERRELYRVIAESNRVLLGVGWRVGVLGGKQRAKVGGSGGAANGWGGSGEEGAWKDVEAGLLWERMREEFELVERFDAVRFKLDLVRDNGKFFLEVVRGEKGEGLEKTIVALIAVECVIMILDMTGLGEKWMSPFF